MRRRLPVLVTTLLAVLVLTAAGCSGNGETGKTATGPTPTGPTPTGPTPTAGTEDKIAIAVVTNSNFNDGGYADFIMQALQGAMNEVGSDRFEDVRTVPNVPYTNELTRTTLQLFEEGADVVIDLAAAGSLFYDACSQVPDKICLEQFPPFDVEPPPNTTGFSFDRPPGYYAIGVAAGMLTETGTIGYLSSFPLGFNTADLNAYALGCQSVRPDCEVRNIYINNFNDPPKEVEAARTLVNSGVDVLAHGLNGPSSIEVAASEGLWVFGVYLDQSARVPERWVTGTNYQAAVQATLTSQLGAIADGTWTASSERLYGPEGGQPGDIALQPWGENVPENVVAKVEEVLQSMNEGNSPFTGPIRDDGGEVRLPEGESYELRSDFVYQGWDYFVNGVIGGA